MRTANLLLVVLISLFMICPNELVSEDRASTLAGSAADAKPVACASVNNSKDCHSNIPTAAPFSLEMAPRTTMRI